MITQKRYLSTAAIAALLATAPTAFAAPPEPVALPKNIIVRALPGTSEAELRSMADKANCEYVRPVEYCPNFYLFRLKGAGPGDNLISNAQKPSDTLKSAIAELVKMPGILADPDYIAYKDGIPLPLVPLAPQGPATRNGAAAKKTRATAPPGTSIRPDDPQYVAGKMKGLDLVRMPEAWNLQFGFRPVVAGVGDSGIDVGHPDFDDRNGVTRIIASRNFTTTDPNDVQDADGHGTHVAGTVAATVGNGVGVASVAGWDLSGMDVKLNIARVLDATGAGGLSGIAAGIGYLTDQNVDVINLSIGTYGDAAILRQSVARAIAANVTIVSSAGNDNNNNTTLPHYPSGYPGVIEVSATNLNDIPSLASYSNIGRSVTIAAPGGDFSTTPDTQIYSTWPRNLPSAIGAQGYNAIAGTSMASPHVAVSSRMPSRFPMKTRTRPTASMARVFWMSTPHC
jgi:subtilisin family serine protease